MASAFDDPMAPSPCEQCGNATEGTMRCSVQDSKNLCQDCFQGLPQARREDIGDPEWGCNIHLNRKADIFCETCQRGCCKECAVDVHQGHNVVNGLKHVGEIRCDLTELLQMVGVMTDGLFKLRREIESSRGKIEEACKVFDKDVDEGKDKIAQNLEQLVQRIQWETQQNIKHEERRRDKMLELAKETADLNIQWIEKGQRDSDTGLLKVTEKIQRAESIILVGQQACESANLEITCLLESTPEKLACRGRQLGSLVKTSLAFQCQNGLVGCFREDGADLEVEKDNFCHGFGPLSPLVKFVLCISVVFYFANDARGGYRDEYNRMLSSKSMDSLIMVYLYFPLCHVRKCFMLTVICGMYDYPITRKESFMQKLKSYIKMVQSGLEFWLHTVLFLMLVSFPLYLFQVKSVSANIVSIMSLMQSFVFLYDTRHSKMHEVIYKIGIAIHLFLLSVILLCSV